MSLTDEEREAIVKYRIEKAFVALEDVNQMTLLGRWSALLTGCIMLSTMLQPPF